MGNKESYCSGLSIATNTLSHILYTLGREKKNEGNKKIKNFVVFRIGGAKKLGNKVKYIELRFGRMLQV